MPSSARASSHYRRGGRGRPPGIRFTARPALKALAADDASGALAIGRKAAGILQDWAHAVRPSRRRQPPLLSDGRPAGSLPFRGEGCVWRHAAESLAVDIVLCQPSMAPPLLLANEVFLALEAASARPPALTRSAVAAAVERACRRFLRMLRRSVPAIRRASARLVRSGSRIVTYSACDGVEELLRRARGRGRRFTVTVSEGRPEGEGAALAERLARAGIEVTLLTDAALFGQLDDADLLLVGANAVCREGVINKAGTAALAEIASARRVPCVVVAGCEKFLPPALSPFLNDGEGPAAKLFRRRVARLKAVNRIFDLTPAGLIDRYATGWGRLAREEVDALLAGMRSSQRLQRALVSRLGRPARRGAPGAAPRGPGRRHPQRRSPGGRAAVRRARR